MKREHMEHEKKFNWTPKPELRLKQYVEEGISEYLDRSNIKPCCSGEMFIEVEITGPLKNLYKCLVKCSCDKELLGFTSNSDMSEINVEYPPEKKTDV